MRIQNHYHPVRRPRVAASNTKSHVTDIFNRVNAYRQSQGLSKLAIDHRICQEAEKHNQNMARVRRISHDGFSGRYSRIKSQICGAKGFAENVAMNMGSRNPPSQAVTQWINSPGHQTNMTGDFNKTGIAVTKNSRGEYYFTQIFIKA